MCFSCAFHVLFMLLHVPSFSFIFLSFSFHFPFIFFPFLSFSFSFFSFSSILCHLFIVFSFFFFSFLQVLLFLGCSKSFFFCLDGLTISFYKLLCLKSIFWAVSEVHHWALFFSDVYFSISFHAFPFFPLFFLLFSFKNVSFSFCFSFSKSLAALQDSLGKSAHSELALFPLYWLVFTFPCGIVHILVMIKLRVVYGGWRVGQVLPSYQNPQSSLFSLLSSFSSCLLSAPLISSLVSPLPSSPLFLSLSSFSFFFFCLSLFPSFSVWCCVCDSVLCVSVCVVLCVCVCGVVCPLNTSPCVHSKRLRVCRQHAHMLFNMCAWCRHARGRVEWTHRGQGGVIASSANQNLPTQGYELTQEVHQRNQWILPIFSLRIGREQHVAVLFQQSWGTLRKE